MPQYAAVCAKNNEIAERNYEMDYTIIWSDSRVAQSSYRILQNPTVFFKIEFLSGDSTATACAPSQPGHMILKLEFPGAGTTAQAAFEQSAEHH